MAMIDRRRFLIRTGLALGSAALARHAALAMPETEPSPVSGGSDWRSVRAQFPLAPGLIHLAGFFLASHPLPVRQAIERHRQGLDLDPIGYWFEHEAKQEAAVLQAAAGYLGVDPSEIALTDSTTMGLGLLYGGSRLAKGRRF